MFKKVSTLILSTTVILSLVPSIYASSAQAEQSILYPAVQPYTTTLTTFKDIEGHVAQTKIEYLLGRDIVMGYDSGAFRPDESLTHAEAITLLTKSFDLKLKNNESIPKLNELYTNINDEAWYSTAYRYAHVNSVKFEANIKTDDKVTREQFAGWIIDQLDQIGAYPVIRMYIQIADINQASEEYKNKIQTLLLTRLAKLDDNENFRPKDAITRGEAAEWVAEVVKFADELKTKQKTALTDNLPFELEVNQALTQEQVIYLIKKAFQLDEAITLTDNDKATTPVTREQLATMIIDEFNKIGGYPIKMMLIHITDEAEITQENAHRVHTLLLTDIAMLDDDGKFRPQDHVIGEDAITWLEKAAVFAERLKATHNE